MAETRTRRIGIVANTGKQDAGRIVNQLAEGFASRKLEVSLETATAKHCGRDDGMDLESLADASDVLVVLGGDGTLLGVAGRLQDSIKPLAAINVGTLGFLTAVTAEDAGRLVDLIATEQIAISHRTIIRAEVSGGPLKEPQIAFGLNEVTIGRGPISRIVHLQTWVNDVPLTQYSGDGLIVATPTGSTAYSLSAGGPLVDPRSKVFVMTPICPHALSNRSVVIGDDSQIRIAAPAQRDEVHMTVDGRYIAQISPDSRIEISRASFDLPLVTIPGYSFYNILRQKLGWTGSNILKDHEPPGTRPPAM